MDEEIRKGTLSERDDSTRVKTDEERAFDLQADYWRMELDLQLAQSLNRALETDANWLAVAQATEDDHRSCARTQGWCKHFQLPSANQRLLEDHHLLPSTSSQCVICGDRLRAQRSFRAPCGDQYCHGCLRDLVQAKTFLPLLSFALRSRFQVKSRELGTPAMSRVYCQNPKGSHGDMVCTACGTAVCSSCKQNAHRGEDCAENAAIQDLRALARDQQWQTCPGCHSIIELNHGVLTQFCYVCAVPWKNCSCPQWDEETGGATCEECNWYLRDFLLVCRHCGLAACVRCSRNRLL
ncbi:hypothetical protein F5146DRAFT_1105963 [Armillaria mellea]|nr:hypothetical protein F5146DRAFT_1105963 [Armillaria mellea]